MPSPPDERRRLRFAARRLYQFDATWDSKFIDFRFGVGDTINHYAPPDHSTLEPTELASLFLSLAEEIEQ